MQAIEVTAKSMDEAKRIASEKLGVGVDQIETTVLEETKGLFGKTNLRVSAKVLEAGTAVVKAEPVSKGRAKAAPKAKAAAAPKVVEEPVVEAAAEAPKKGRGRAGAKPVEAKAETAATNGHAEERSGEGEPEIIATEENAEQLAKLLRDLIASADLTVDVTPSGLNGRYVNITLDGKDAAFLVGKHGEVLNALQYLTNIIGSRKIANGVRVTLDGNDYRRRREETLTALAVNIAEQVKKRREEAVLDALPAFERRIVHKALSTVTGITTYSEGEEPNRRVVIAPAE
jgi:spoIIIJ-associated protein